MNVVATEPFPPLAVPGTLDHALGLLLRECASGTKTLRECVQDAEELMDARGVEMTDGPVTEPNSQKRVEVAFHFWTMRHFAVRDAARGNCGSPFLCWDGTLANNPLHRLLNRSAIPTGHILLSTDGPACLLNCKCTIIPMEAAEIENQGFTRLKAGATHDPSPLGMGLHSGFPDVPFLLPDSWMIKSNFCSYDKYFR